MAYAAVLSLVLRIEQLLKSCGVRHAPCFREILEFAHNEVESEEIAKRILWSSASSLDLDIRMAVCKLRDVVEQIVNQWRSDEAGIQSYRVLQNIKKDFHFCIETLKEYIKEYYNPSPDEEEHDAVSSRADFGGNNYSKMVGLSDVYKKFKRCLMDPFGVYKLGVVPLVGMPGIGKTTLAKEIFQDPEIVKHFDCRVLVTIGQKYQLKDIPRLILAQLNPDMSDQMLAELGDEDTAYGYLKESLKGKRYLIVLDDVWSKYMAHNFKTCSILPDEENGSQVLLTTRLQQVNNQNSHIVSRGLPMRLLNKEESWELLRKKVFVQELCSPQLEKAGKEIAKKCDGLPLTIVTIANLLSKLEKTPRYWSEVAAQKNHQLFVDAYDEMTKVLLPSYKYLSRLLQMCFLYMGVFPQNYEIPIKKLFNMWDADGFLELDEHKFPSPSAMQYLEELVSSSLVKRNQCTIQSAFFAEGYKQIKSCSLHSSLWYLSNKEAEKTKFSHILSSRNDGLGEGIESQCRLSFHNNILFGIKDVYESVEYNCASTAHSLLSYGPYHQYQVPICFGLRDLRILDALTIRFYQFPTEIWNMKELQNLQVMGSDLPDPHGASLERLLKLSNVSANSCTKEIFEAIPNLEKLGIQIELAPDDGIKPLRCFDHISYLRLRSLKCVIVNPKVVSAPPPFSIFPSCLQKLTLSGLGYPWREMSKIASLSYLAVLKLQNYAFQGPTWEVEEKGFSQLRILVIKDTNLVEWKIGDGSFQELRYLSMKHCYKLERIHEKIARYCLHEIELADCNALGVKQMEKARLAMREVSIHSSWDDGSSRVTRNSVF